MKRREFIKSTALITAMASSIPSFSASRSGKVGLQLYSLRDVIKTDVKGVLTKVAGFGYKELETYGYSDGKLFDMKSSEFAKIVKDLGMKITSGHYGTGQMDPAAYKGTISNDWNRAADDAKEAGQDYMTISSLQDKERDTISALKKTCEILNKGGEVCKKHGMMLGYHNHAVEFSKIEGQVIYDVMLKELDPKLVSMEMDLFWVYNAGQDPFKYFEKYPGRFHQWHVKDMDKSNKDLNADIGMGSIDFKALFAKASQSGMKHFYIEQENYGVSPLASVENGIKYLKTIV